MLFSCFKKPSCMYNPHQNGISEKKIGHIMEKDRGLMFQSNGLGISWGEETMTIIPLIN